MKSRLMSPSLISEKGEWRLGSNELFLNYQNKALTQTENFLRERHHVVGLE